MFFKIYFMFPCQKLKNENFITLITFWFLTMGKILKTRKSYMILHTIRKESIYYLSHWNSKFHFNMRFSILCLHLVCDTSYENSGLWYQMLDMGTVCTRGFALLHVDVHGALRYSYGMNCRSNEDMQKVFLLYVYLYVPSEIPSL